MENDYLRWSEVPYGGEIYPPDDPVDPHAGSWPTYYITRVGELFVGPNGEIVIPRDPRTIDWRKELEVVQCTLENITRRQIELAKYWGSGPPTKQWTPIVDRLVDTYNLSPGHAARVLAAVQAGINDTLVVVWHYKYLWDVARPIQYDPCLEPILCTPRFPTYVSGHAAISGCAQTILSYFFPGENIRLKELAEEDAMSRLYAGVHFPVDNAEGLKLGRQIGAIIVRQLEAQKDDEGNKVDNPNVENLHARLQPPPYRQAIPFHYSDECSSRTL